MESNSKHNVGAWDLSSMKSQPKKDFNYSNGTSNYNEFSSVKGVLDMSHNKSKHNHFNTKPSSPRAHLPQFPNPYISEQHSKQYSNPQKTSNDFSNFSNNSQKNDKTIYVKNSSVIKEPLSTLSESPQRASSLKQGFHLENLLSSSHRHNTPPLNIPYTRSDAAIDSNLFNSKLSKSSKVDDVVEVFSISDDEDDKSRQKDERNFKVLSNENSSLSHNGTQHNQTNNINKHVHNNNNDSNNDRTQKSIKVAESSLKEGEIGVVKEVKERNDGVVEEVVEIDMSYVNGFDEDDEGDDVDDDDDENKADEDSVLASERDEMSRGMNDVDEEEEDVSFSGSNLEAKKSKTKKSQKDDEDDDKELKNGEETNTLRSTRKRRRKVYMGEGDEDEEDDDDEEDKQMMKAKRISMMSMEEEEDFDGDAGLRKRERMLTPSRGRGRRGRGIKRGMSRGMVGRMENKLSDSIRKRMSEKKVEDDDDDDYENLRKAKKKKSLSISERIKNANSMAAEGWYLLEYEWSIGRGDNSSVKWWLIESQLNQLLGFKLRSRYSNLLRRVVNHPREIAYLLKQGCINPPDNQKLKNNSENSNNDDDGDASVSSKTGDFIKNKKNKLKNISVLCSQEVVEILAKHFPSKHQDYQRAVRRKKLNGKESPEKPPITTPCTTATTTTTTTNTINNTSRYENLLRKSLKSASTFNSMLNKERTTERQSYFDLQTFEIQHAQKVSKKAALFSTKLLCESYPVSVVPGQFQESYRRYDPTELFYMPLNTAIFTPPKHLDGSLQPEPSSVNLHDDEDNDVDEEDEDDETMSTAASSNAAKQNVAADVSTTSVVSVKKIRRGGPGRGRKHPMSVTARCSMCGQGWLNKYQEQDQLVRCCSCHLFNHTACLGIHPDMVQIIRTYKWQCMECKVCSKCAEPHDEDKMVFCDRCDRGYHTYCEGLSNIPEGRWECGLCLNIPSNTPVNKPKRGRPFKYPRNPLTNTPIINNNNSNNTSINNNNSNSTPNNNNNNNNAAIANHDKNKNGDIKNDDVKKKNDDDVDDMSLSLTCESDVHDNDAKNNNDNNTSNSDVKNIGNKDDKC